jgi:3-hydroxyisobutyrate dehydrogenase-like beta-hydroxyacid dehydrogenase
MVRQLIIGEAARCLGGDHMSDQHDGSRHISVIGLGAMGAGIARVFMDHGCRVSVWNRTRAKVDALVSKGAIGCESPRDAMGANEHVVVCVSDYGAWQTIIDTYDLASHLDGTCVIQLTTGTIDEVQAHASLLKVFGARLAEGAVMCYPRHLGTADASLLMSGANDVLDSCSPFLNMLDENWTTLGEDLNRPAVLSRSLMAGMTAALMGIVNGAAICRAGGVSLDVFMKFYDKNNGIILREQKRLVEAIRDGRTKENEASIKAWREGNQALLSVAASLGTDLTLQNALQAVFQEGSQQGLDEHDLSALVDVFDPASGS